jgi:tetratricopeptide (TPR) repeat protein
MPQQTDTLLQQSCSLIVQGNTDAAISALQELLGQHHDNAAALQMLGLVHVMRGDMHGAARLLRQACVITPENGSLRLHLARAEWETGLPAQAAASYQQAIALGCADADTQVDCAIALQALKRHAVALEHCDAALAQDPRHARAWKTKANLLHELKRMEEALACHDHALALQPDATAWSNKAATLDLMGRLEEALDCHRSALACDPAIAASWTHCGATLRKMERHEEALAHHVRATEIDPRHANAWSNTGLALCKLKRGDEAVAAHDKAVSLQPSMPQLWLQRGATLIILERNAEALASFNAALRLDPLCTEAWHHRGAALNCDNRHEEALESLEEALALDPASTKTFLLYVRTLQYLDRHAEALELPKKKTSENPGDPGLRFDLAVSQLADGDFANGWANFQSCRDTAGYSAPRHVHLPLWSGDERITGKRLLIYAEQGYGDVIQFCRYATVVAAMGCEVVLEVYSSMKQLISTLPGCQIIAAGEPPPECDFRIPLMALPLALRAQAHDIPCQSPYLHATHSALPAPGERRAGNKLRVGLACSGNPLLHTNRSRSVPLAAFEPLKKYGTLLLLQNTVMENDAAYLAVNSDILHPTAGITDFADTADIIASLDLVISIDTAIAHLAGALGKPVWILLSRPSEWRWFRERSDSPWYPTARLFRQSTPGDWDGVLARVQYEVRLLASRHGCLLRGAA